MEHIHRDTDSVPLSHDTVRQSDAALLVEALPSMEPTSPSPLSAGGGASSGPHSPTPRALDPS